MAGLTGAVGHIHTAPVRMAEVRATPAAAVAGISERDGRAVASTCSAEAAEAVAGSEAVARRVRRRWRGWAVAVRLAEVRMEGRRARRAGIRRAHTAEEITGDRVAGTAAQDMVARLMEGGATVGRPTTTAATQRTATVATEIPAGLPTVTATQVTAVTAQRMVAHGKAAGTETILWVPLTAETAPTMEQIRIATMQE